VTGKGALAEGPLLIGVGTEHRHDDSCGLEVARRLRARSHGRFRVVEAIGESTALLDLWEGEARVVVVDAARSGALAGTHRAVEVVADVASPSASISTHGFSIAEAIALGRVLGRMPARLTLHTLEAADVSMGDGLSAPVAAAADRLVDLLEHELGRAPTPGGARHA